MGILAGWGRYPLVIAEALRRQGCEVYCLGTIGHADPRAGRGVRRFPLVRAGQVRRGHPLLPPPRRDRSHDGRQDLQGAAVPALGAGCGTCPTCGRSACSCPISWTRKKDCRDDSLLGAIVEEFAAEGIRFAPATDYAPELLVSEGQLTRRGPTAWQQKDIEFGWQMAKEMGRLDIGQSVAVKDQAVLAVEAVEGTDECIRRAGALCRAGGFTVVKVAKPQQDMRFDVPTIGLGTLETLLAAGGKVLAVEAGRTILLDQAAVIEFADRNGLVIVAMEGTNAE